MRTVAALIPARGGSKGIPGKNLKPLAGKPLLQYSIESARAARSVSRIFLSTDSEEIAAAGRALGAEVPFLRPASAATDASPMIEVVRHFLAWAEQEGLALDAIALLQPTSPLRPPGIIDQAVDQFFACAADSAVTVAKVPHRYGPGSLMKQNGQGLLEPLVGGRMQPTRRQDKEILFARNGPAVLVFSPQTLSKGSLYGEKIVGVEMDEASSVDIDTAFDFWLAERLVEHGHEPF